MKIQTIKIKKIENLKKNTNTGEQWYPEGVIDRLPMGSCGPAKVGKYKYK